MYRDPMDGGNKLSSETIEKYNHLGVGWSHNLPYIFTDNSSGVQVINLCFGGGVYELDANGLGIYRSKTNPDKSNILWYDLLDMRVYRESGVKYGDCAGFAGLAQQYNLPDSAETENLYVLLLKDNSRYWFRADGQLMMQEDRTGLNRIWYFHDAQSRLILAVDTVGRQIRFQYDANGNLAALEWEVDRYIKGVDGLPQLLHETRRIEYRYESTEKFSSIAGLKGWVANYREPFSLVSVTDPEQYVTRYDYTDGLAYFSYDSFKARSQHVYLLLKEITTMEGANGKYRNKQCFEYNPPVQGLYSKLFYQGFFEYYKISRQYFKDRNGRIMNDTSYIYHGQGEAGNVNQYTAALQQGNLKTTYVYSVSGDKCNDNVLDKMILETRDGFKEERDYIYNENRAKILEEVYRGQFIYREKYEYDLKGNLKWFQDKMVLITATE
mgnify:CR=1 FL=1